jgi:hypothetical protein
MSRISKRSSKPAERPASWAFGFAKRGAALWQNRRRPWAGTEGSRKPPSDSQNAGRASSVPDAESSQRSFVDNDGKGEAPQKTPTRASNVMHTATRSLSGALAHKGLRLTHFFHR